jgi:oligopeptidase B
MDTGKHIEEWAGGGPGNVRGAAVGSSGGTKMQAPLAEREAVEHVIHGDRRVDHYAWMKNKKDPRVRAYLEAENAYADAEMRGTEEFQEKLYQEMLGRIQQTDLSVPYRLRGYEYYTRTEEGKQYPIYCRKKTRGDQQSGKEEKTDSTMSRRSGRGKTEQEVMEELRAELRAGFGASDPADAGRSPAQFSAELAEQGEQERLRENPGAQAGMPVPLEEEVLLDLNELAAGHTFMGLGIFEVSDDNRWLAYATDTTGYRQYVLEVKELGTGREVAAGEVVVASKTGEEEALRSRIGGGYTEIEKNQRPASENVPYKGEYKGGGRRLRVERVTSVAWAMDSRTLFYVTEDEVTKRSNQLWRHVFGEVASGEWRVASEGEGQQRGAESAEETRSQESHEGGLPFEAQGEQPSLPEGGVKPPLRGESKDLIYEEKDERFRMDVERSRSGAYLFLVINSHTTSEARYLRADSPFSGFQLVAEREDDHEYYIDHHPGSASDPAGGVFFIRTNSLGRTYRLVTAPVGEPGRSRWHEVIGNRPGVMLAGLEVFRTHLVLTEREDGLPHLRIVDLTREAASALEASERLIFSEPAYQAMLGTNPEFDTETVRFQYESMVTPRTVYDYEVRTGRWILRKQQPVLGDFDAGNYVSERLHAKAADGTGIPISLVRRKSTARDGIAPLLLYGYGSYGFSMPAIFSSNRLSLLDRGMVYAIAHVRGGGELGKPWHDAGRMHQKMNTFTDFIACADYLVAKRYTSAEGLVIEGGSAGGLLMGAVTNMAPEKFRAVVSHVPFVDVLNTMLDASLPLTVGEYEEWGNPEVAEDYFYMKKYCPYTNVERKSYPRMLVKTAWNDSQVMYWEAAKYVAKLRAMKTDGNVLLLKTNMGAGHGGASGRYDFLREIATDYAFLLREVGVEA